jgi:alpha-L-arabinofuranosidase
MGRKRAADGHADQYKLRYIELGNEQYNSNYLDQVVAMETRANAVGAAGQLHGARFAKACVFMAGTVQCSAQFSAAKKIGIPENRIRFF